MPKYIDADLLKLGINKNDEIFCTPVRPLIIDLIDNMPTIDNAPVKHGRWVKSDTQRHVEVTYECSECQHEVVGEYEKTPFCGGCGARMGR